MPEQASGQDELDPATRAFYRHVLATVGDAGLPFLVGGAYALQQYTHIERHTKDVDILVRPRDFTPTLDVLGAAGYRIEGVFHWVGKAYCENDCVDVICNSTNGVTPIDDAWFEHAVAAELLGLPLKLAAPEDLLWVKSFVMERERYDGADVAHLLHARAERLDWQRLLDRFGPLWRVLLSHIVLFGFIYPEDRTRVPTWVMRELLGHLHDELNNPPPSDHLCRGTLLSWRQYLPDIEQQGYRDARLVYGYMSEDEIDRWTDAWRDK